MQDAEYYVGFNHRLSDEKLALADALQGNFIGGGYRLFTPSLSGFLDLSLDTHFRTLVSDSADDFHIVSPSVAYRSLDRRLYVDFAYALSRYQENNLSVQQFTPTIGFTLNHRDWFQVRGYIIDPSEFGDLSFGSSISTAAEGSWTHRFSGNMLGVSRIKASAMLGKRNHSLDQELKTAQSSAYAPNGALSFSLFWTLPYNLDLIFQNSVEQVTSHSSSDPYRLNYGVLGIEHRW